MTLLQRIKTDQIQARKSKEPLKINLLTTLLAEAAKPGLDDGKRESTDSEVIAVIKKFVKNINETLSVSPNEDLKAELVILQSYLPQQLTEEEIRVLLTNNHNLTNVGEAMRFLKEHFNGQYDGRVANAVAKQIFP